MPPFVAASADAWQLSAHRAAWLSVPPHVLRADVPAHVREGLRAYFCDHCRPGDFLCAVLANDLTQALCRADPSSLAALRRLLTVLTTWGPQDMLGSYATIHNWTADRFRWEAARAELAAREAEAVLSALDRA